MATETAQGRPGRWRFPVIVGVISLIAAASTALCLALDLPAWGMFIGWIAFSTGGGARSGAIAWGSVMLGLVLGMAGALTMEAGSGLGFIAIPAVVFVITCIAVAAQRAPLLDSVVGYFIGMTAFFASGLMAGINTFGILALPISIGSMSGYIASLLAARLAKA